MEAWHMNSHKIYDNHLNFTKGEKNRLLQIHFQILLLPLTIRKQHNMNDFGSTRNHNRLKTVFASKMKSYEWTALLGNVMPK